MPSMLSEGDGKGSKGEAVVIIDGAREARGKYQYRQLRAIEIMTTTPISLPGPEVCSDPVTASYSRILDAGT